MIKQFIFLILLNSIISIFIYKNSFQSYYFQDDWFSIKISQATNLPEFISFFRPRSDVIYYRPLGMQVPFFLITHFFHHNIIPFHILTFVNHIFNSILVCILVFKLLKNWQISVLLSVLYDSSIIHYIPFYWKATYAFVLGPTFFFLSFYLFLLFVEFKKIKYYLFSLIIFFFGLISNEIVFVLPLILCCFITLNRIMKKYFIYILSFFLIDVAYLITRFIFFKPILTEEYVFTFNQNIVTNLRAYFLWSFNWPEEMKAQFVSFFKVNPLFVSNFTSFYTIFIATFIISIVFFYTLPLIFSILGKIKLNYYNLIFGLIWFVIRLLPVLFFVKHTYAYYLPISFVGLYFGTFSVFQKFYQYILSINKYLAYLLLSVVFINWITISFTSVIFNSKVHWVYKRSLLSKKVINEAVKYFNSNKEANNFVVERDQEIKWVLNRQDALQIYFNNPSIMTVYQ